MSGKECYVCKKGVSFGNNVSHANNKLRRVVEAALGGLTLLSPDPA